MINRIHDNVGRRGNYADVRLRTNNPI